MSETVNTNKVTKTVYGNIQVKDTIKPIGEDQDLKGNDLAFLKFPVIAYRPSKKTSFTMAVPGSDNLLKEPIWVFKQL